MPWKQPAAARVERALTEQAARAWRPLELGEQGSALEAWAAHSVAVRSSARAEALQLALQAGAQAQVLFQPALAQGQPAAEEPVAEELDGPWLPCAG